MNHGLLNTELMQSAFDPEAGQSSTDSILPEVPSEAQKTAAVPNEPTAREMSEVTVMLAAVQRGEAKAAEDLLKLVYDELRRLAAYKMAQQPPGHTLQPTALVHEAWLKLVGSAHP